MKPMRVKLTKPLEIRGEVQMLVQVQRCMWPLESASAVWLKCVYVATPGQDDATRCKHIHNGVMGKAMGAKVEKEVEAMEKRAMVLVIIGRW